MFLGIPPKPANGGFAIMDLSGPLGFSAQAVCDRSAGISSGLHEGSQAIRPMTASLIPVFPPSAMYPNDEGATVFFGGAFFGDSEVKGLPGVGGSCIG